MWKSQEVRHIPEATEVSAGCLSSPFTKGRFNLQLCPLNTELLKGVLV